MSRPPFSIWSAFYTIEFAAGIRLELVHDSLGANFCLHDSVYVSRPHAGSQKIPAAMRAMLTYCCQHHFATGLVEDIRLVEHASAFYRDTLRVGSQRPAARQIVAPVHRSPLVAMEVSAIAGEGDQVPH